MRLGVLVALAGCSFQPRLGEVPAGLDAAEPDTFEVARCPASYTLTLPGQSSRYRVITDGRKAWEHADDCADDLAGATHLVAVDDLAERAHVEAAVTDVGGIAGNKAWLGGVQPRDQIGVRIGWLTITGGPLLDGLWDDGEPNDGGVVEDNGENFAGVERGRTGLVDFPSNDNYGGVCECDGKPIDPTAQAALDANRQ